jgi:hypothetical protein
MREREKRKSRRVKGQARAGLYSPTRMGYRTWFYAAFVCAYACCSSFGMTPPVPFHDPAGSRTCSVTGQVRSNYRMLLLHVPFPCFRDLCLVRGSGPGADSPHSSVGRTACGLPSDYCSCKSGPTQWVRAMLSDHLRRHIA